MLMGFLLLKLNMGSLPSLYGDFQKSFYEKALHLAVVAHGQKLAVFAQESRRSQRFGKTHLRRLVHHYQVKIRF